MEQDETNKLREGTSKGEAPKDALRYLEDQSVQEGYTYLGYTYYTIMKGQTGKEYRHQLNIKFAGSKTLEEMESPTHHSSLVIVTLVYKGNTMTLSARGEIVYP